jgi:hypothetical protein
MWYTDPYEVKFPLDLKGGIPGEETHQACHTLSATSDFTITFMN